MAPKHPLALGIPALLLLAAFAACFPAVASVRAAGEGGLRLEVLVDGVPLAEHAARGTTYVEALKGREYSLRLTNLEPVRVAVALVVDGRNTIDGARSSAKDARKWILSPYQTVVLEGWQSSDREAHRFVFTSEPKSYASWLGDASAAGVIEAVSFRERVPEPPQDLSWIPWRNEADDGFRDARKSRAGGRFDAPPPASAPAASAAGEPARQEASAASGLEGGVADSKSKDALRESEESAATGFGRGVQHRVTRVAFDSETQPCGSARLRYEYRDALVRLGVLPAPTPRDVLARREGASGFTGYCPVPSAPSAR